MTAKEKLTALADAVREKTGETGLLTLDTMTSLISSLEGGGGASLPNGWGTGSFNTTPQTIKGDIEIEHGLDAVPDVVIVFCENTSPAGYAVRGLIRFNLSPELDEETGLYYPNDSDGRLFQFNATGTATTLLIDSGTGMDTNKTIYIPKGNSYTMYVPAFTYRWIAIKLGG